VNVIFGCAASVDFNEFLKDAIQINYFGCLRMLELAKECKRLDVYTHVSTAYVNSDKEGFVDEKIYDIDFDIVTKISSIMGMPNSEIVDRSMELIHPFPNTYTFTKSMAERILLKRRGDLPVILYRPAIIIAAY
jgi:nucleoside-diphosphate-sugar epimerase